MSDDIERQARAPEEEPEVYTVKKDRVGWKFNRRRFLTAASATAAAAVVGAASGCGGSESQVVEQTVVVIPVTATPTPGPELTDTPLPTEAAEATATEAPTATDTPLPTEVPTDTPTPTPALPKARFVKDVTVPDGSVMAPGQKFTKTWRFQNVGSVSWGAGVRLVFVAGKQKGFDSKQMGAPEAVDVADVAAGKTADVSVALTAPNELGHYRSYWRLQLGTGEWLENIHYADIFVASKEALAPGERGAQFKAKDTSGTMITWTQPCGSPIPPGAVCVCNCVTAELPGQAGTVPAGQEGINFTGPGGETRWMPCGSPIPAGWTCTCNCVTVPAACTCDQVCSCDGVCSCDNACTCD